jgi:hypothetical protein
VQVITLEKFSIDYRSDGSVGQYRSVFSESDLNGRVEQQKEIYVNEPMRFGGVTVYQVLCCDHRTLLQPYAAAIARCFSPMLQPSHLASALCCSHRTLLQPYAAAIAPCFSPILLWRSAESRRLLVHRRAGEEYLQPTSSRSFFLTKQRPADMFNAWLCDLNA